MAEKNTELVRGLVRSLTKMDLSKFADTRDNIIARLDQRDDLLAALRLELAYEMLSSGRARGQAWAAFAAARDAAIAKAEGQP